MRKYKNTKTKLITITKVISVTPKAVHVVLENNKSIWLPKSHIVGKVLRDVKLTTWFENNWDFSKWDLNNSASKKGYTIPLGIVFSNHGAKIESATVEITEWLYKTKNLTS